MVALNLDSLALSQDLKDMWVPYSKKASKVASKGAGHKSYLNFRVKAIEKYLICNPFPRKSNLLNLSQLNNLMTKNSLRYFAVILILSIQNFPLAPQFLKNRNLMNLKQSKARTNKMMRCILMSLNKYD